MPRVVLLGLISLVLAACTSTREGQKGAVLNPLQQIGQAPGLLQHLPVLQAHPAPMGPAMDAYPVVEPPEVKQVWIVPHDNHYGDRIAGHYVHVLYHKPRFAPMPTGVARIPIAPRLEEMTPDNPTPAGTLVPHDTQGAPLGAARQPSAPPRSSKEVSPQLAQYLEQFRQRMQTQQGQAGVMPQRLEDAP